MCGRLLRTIMTPMPITSDLVIRLAGPDEGAAVTRLAELDSAPAPAGAVLLAEVGHQLWAALSLEDGSIVADPFRPSGGVVALLAERGRQLGRRPRRRTRPKLRAPGRPALV